MKNRQNISSNTIYEEKNAYSRAVRIGNMVFVAGTTALDGEKIVAPNDAYTQSMFIFEKIEKALKATSASMKDVVQTRMFLTNIADGEAVGKAHKAFFDEIRPVATMVEINALVDPALVVEIEVMAVIGE